ncbi:MAG: helix-turn-helix transcriptional regulator [Jatrophihabitantaceae bacterium]
MDRLAVAAIAALEDDVRAALFACVRDAPGPLTREAAADAVGISRKLAAFHLDKLVSAGLLKARIEAVGPRRVGRAPKVYEPSGRDVVVGVPQREHRALAEILLAAVLGERTGERATDAAFRVARERGAEVGNTERERVRPGRIGAERALTMASQVLQSEGYEPARDGAAVRLRNCPFHPLAQSSPELVCGLNHAYLCGVLEGLRADGSVEAVLAPREGACCVELHRR